MEVLALTLGAIGTVGTITLGLAQWKRGGRQEEREINRDERSIHVGVRLSWVVQDRAPIFRTIEIRAVNNGHRPIQVDEFDFLDADGQPLYADLFEEVPLELPKLLTDGEGVRAGFYLDELMHDGTAVKIASACVTDAYGYRWIAGVDDMTLERLRREGAKTDAQG